MAKIICNGYLDFKEKVSKHHYSLQEAFDVCGFKIIHLEPFVKDGLLTYQNHCLRVTSKGFLFVRNIAVLFDPAYKMKSQLYSKSV